MKRSLAARSIAATAVALAIVGLCTVPGSASVTEALDLLQLVRESDAVVVGRAVHSEAHWDSRRRIVTDVTVEVERTMKGDAAEGEQLVLRQLGGSIGELGMRVAGEPQLGVGDRAVLFGRRMRGTHLRPVGMSQGVLPVRVEAGVEMVHPGGAGLALVRRVRGQVVTAPPALLDPRPLDEVVADIRAAVEETRDR